MNIVATFRDRLRSLKPDRSNLKSDFLAALTFAIVGIPQAMAHALLVAVNPVLGIYTLMIAVPVAAVFTSSVFMNVSTTGALSIIAGDELAAFSPEQRVVALATLVALAGIFQLVAGFARLGFILRFVSDAVMTGFLNGVAVLIILGQLGALTGFESTFSNSVMKTLDLLARPGRIELPTFLIGALTIGTIVVLLRTRLDRFAFVLAIVLSTLVLAGLSLLNAGAGPDWSAVDIVRDIGAIPRELPRFALPSPDHVLAMILPALTLALIGLVYGAGVGQTFRNPDGRYPSVSGDFLGQGAGNLASSLVGGLPAGGSLSGTILTTSAGARSRWTGIFGGLCVVLVVLLAAPLAEQVPMPALAALLIVAGFRALQVEQAVMVWNTSKVSAAAMILTFVGTLIMPLHYAVLMGVSFSVWLFVIQRANQSKVVELALVPGGYREERAAPAFLPSDQFVALFVSGSLYFAAARTLESILPSAQDSRRCVVALGLRGQPEVGSTFLNVLRRYAEALRSNDGKLMLYGVDAKLHAQLARSGLLQLLGPENVFPETPRLGEALDAAAEAARIWLEQAPRSQS